MKKTLIAVLAMALLLAIGCGSALAYTGDLTTSDAKIYSDSAMTNCIGAIPAGTSVLVRSYETYADIYYKGKVVYIKTSDLLQGDIEGDYNATLLKGTKVYQRADTASDHYKLKGAVTVNVCAVAGSWALVRTLNAKGIFAFVKINKLVNIKSK